MHDHRPSGTATLIARSLLLLSRDPKRASLVSPQAAEACGWFLAAGGENPERFRRLVGHGWFRALIYSVERCTLPGILYHYALRKRSLEEFTRRGLEAGAAQVVVLGAGFDTLSLRLHEQWPQVMFWEMDHPATQQVKQNALAAHGLPGDNLRLVPLDLTVGRLKDVLAAQPAFRPDAATLFLAEGLLMYLTPKQTAGIFQDIRACSGRGSQVAFTFLEPQAHGQVNFARSSRLIDFWLRKRGEPFRWGLKQAEAAVYLGAQGFALCEVITPPQLRRLYLPGDNPASPATGDLIAVCLERGAGTGNGIHAGGAPVGGARQL